MKFDVLVTGLSLFIILVITNTLFIVNNSALHLKIQAITSVFDDLTKETAIFADQNILNYFRGKEILEQDLFSSQAQTHLSDVKNLIRASFAIDLLALLIFLIFFFRNFNDKTKLTKSIYFGAALSIFIVLIVGALSYINFSEVFVIFHKVIFRNNLWLFSDQDLLIKIYPSEFFAEIAKQLFLNIVVSALIIMAITKFLLARK